jgi:hypothetical protein
MFGRRRGEPERRRQHSDGRSRSHAEGAPDVSAQERAEHEFIKRIAKLLSVGMKAEAELSLLSKLHGLEPKGAPLTGRRHNLLPS